MIGGMDTKPLPTPDVLACAPDLEETDSPPQGDPLDFLNEKIVSFRVQMCVHTLNGTIQVPVICFKDSGVARGVIAQHLDMEDPRLKCQGWMMAMQTTLGSVQEGLALTLRQGGYPAMVGTRYHLVNVTLAPCKADAPWSVVVTYFFKGPDYIEPAITFWPESLVKRTTCGICPTCDPEGKNTAVAEQMRKGAEAAMTEAHRRAAEAAAVNKHPTAPVPVDGQQTAERPVVLFTGIPRDEQQAGPPADHEPEPPEAA
jgi:hypothetical protein